MITLVLESKNQIGDLLESVKDPRNVEYLVIGDRNPDIISELSALGCKELTPPTRNEEFKENFLREYIDIVGAIGAEQKSRLWWATDISSKNRFASKAADFLSQFLLIAEAAAKSSDPLVVLDPPWQIIDSLVGYFEKSQIPYRIQGYKSAKRKDIFFSRAKRAASVIRQSAILLRKIFLTKRICQVNFTDLKEPYYIVKSFIYDHSFSENGNYRDAFFGSLPQYLKERKRVLILADILGYFKKGLENISRCSDFEIIPLESMLSAKDILATACEGLLCRFRVQNKYFLFGKYEVSSIFRNELARTFNGLAFYQMFHFRAVQNLLKLASIDTFLLTYENNPWEKMCIQAIRSYSPGTRIVGYQHTVVPQSSANMFISNVESKILPKPDLILTVGDGPREIMERYGVFEKGLVKASCGLRFEYLFKLPVKERMRNGNIALILEGIPEVYKMVDYVLGELGNTSYRIRIRTHPVLPWDSISPNITRPWTRMNNIEFSSNKSIKEDIEWADVVIYWGTTVALEALSMGAPVIHFDTGSVLSFDPLFECSNLKWKISENGSLSDVLDEIYGLDDQTFLAEQTKAKDYLNRYFHPITDAALNKFIIN